MKGFVKENNNRIKYTVHEALKDYDNKNNQTIIEITPIVTMYAVIIIQLCIIVFTVLV